MHIFIIAIASIESICVARVILTFGAVDSKSGSVYILFLS